MKETSLNIVPLSPHFGSVINPSKTQNLFDLDLHLVMKQFNESGALLFRGFDMSHEDFVGFTDQLSHNFSTYKGGALRFEVFDREMINNNETVLSTTGGSQAFPLPLHGELYYLKNRPTMIWFYCKTPPQAKGETTICNGVKLFQQLNPKTQDLLRKNKIKYIRHLSKEDWQVTFQTDDLNEIKNFCRVNNTNVIVHDDQSMTTEFTCEPILKIGRGETYINSIAIVYYAEWAYESGWMDERFENTRDQCPIQVRLQDGSRLPSDIMDEIKHVSADLQAAISWEKGDLLGIDNRWIMHGRNEADSSNREIFARFGEPLF